MHAYAVHLAIVALFAAIEAVAPQAGATAVTNATLLRPEDFTYIGGFTLPAGACGASTAFASGGIALRRVAGALRLIAAGHVSPDGDSRAGSRLYEVMVPPADALSADPQGWPAAAPSPDSAAFCELGYGGRRRVGPPPADPADVAVWTHGLHHDPEQGRLYVSYGDVYNADASNDHFLCLLQLRGDRAASPPARDGWPGGSPRPHAPRGPWRAAPIAGADLGGMHSQKLRGGALTLPRWFTAAAGLGPRSLGLGFGGYYNIIGPGSMGPVLAAVEPPALARPGAAPLRPVLLLGHAAHEGAFGRYARRPPDYWIAPGLSWGRNATAERGYWAPGDSIEGAGVWIDTPERHGLLFFADLARGRVAYEDGAVTAQATAPAWLFYDPADLLRVASGAVRPWSVAPRQIWSPPPYPATGPAPPRQSGAARRVTGAAWDGRERVLYLAHLHSRTLVEVPWEQGHVVHAWRLAPRA